MSKKTAVFVLLTALTVMCSFRILVFAYGILSFTTFTALLMVCLAAIALSLRKLLNDFHLESNYLKIVLALFFIYDVITIARGFEFGSDPMRGYLQSEYVFWPFIIPIFIFFDKELLTYAYLLRGFFVLAVIFLVIAALQSRLITKRETAEMFIHTFVFTSGFILLNANYLSRKMRNVALLALLVGDLCFIYLARRNGIVSYSLLILFALGLNMLNTSATRFFKIFPLLTLLIVTGFFFIDYIPEQFTKKITDRATEDSRSIVFNDLFKSMRDEEAFGHGMNGKYYSPAGGTVSEDGTVSDVIEYRDVIENGYLQLYLNGGITLIVLFLMVTLPAAFLGIFRSQNQFGQAAGIVVLLWLIDMAIFGLPRLTPEYVLVWICVGICYKKSLREYTDDEIADVFFNYKEYESTLVH